MHAQKIGSGQSSRSQPQARRIVGSGDENDTSLEALSKKNPRDRAEEVSHLQRSGMFVEKLELKGDQSGRDSNTKRFSGR